MALLHLITDRAADPTLDTAVSSALLHRVADGAIGPTLRLFTPGRVVAFGSQDRIRPGYRDAVDAVRALGYEAVTRLAGGKAAVFHEGTVAFAWSMPLAEPKDGIEQRYEAISSIIVDALDRLGVSAAVGELPGEYCPGRFSVHANGGKVMGVGQRLVRAAAHVGGVVVVNSPDLVNRPLVPAYRALEYEWDPTATGAAGDFAVAQAQAALTAAFEAAGHSLQSASLTRETLTLAESFVADHRPEIP